MLIMAVLLLAGTTFLTISSTESQIAANERAATQAILIAEAGVRRAMTLLSANSGYTGTGGTPLSIGSGTATIEVASATSTCPTNAAREVKVTAGVPVGGGQAQAQIKVVLDKISYPFRWATFSAIRNGILGYYTDPNRGTYDNRTDREIWLRGNSMVDVFDSSRGAYGGDNSGLPGGKIGAFGDVWLESGTRIKGGVIVGDGLIATGATIDAFQLSLQSQPFEAFPSLLPTPSGTPGSISLPSGSWAIGAGTYYFSSMTIADNTSIVVSGGQVTIYITGDVLIGNSVTLGSSPGTNLRIVTKSDDGGTGLQKFQAGNDFILRGALYGRNTDVFLGDRAQVFGSIIGRTILAGDNSQIHYDQAMARQPICGGSGDKYTIRRGTWRQIVP
jgi:hypothetical protein